MAYAPFKMKGPSLYKFNAGLRKASAEGELDSNPKFKAAVDSSPNKKYKSAMKKKGCAMCNYGKKKCNCGKSPMSKRGCGKKY